MSSDDLLFANRHYSHPSHSLRISKLVGEEFTQLGDDFGTVHSFTAVALVLMAQESLLQKLPPP